MTSGGKAPGSQHQARTVTYKHGGDKYEVTVGQHRQVHRRKTGPRGGYIKNADWQGWSTVFLSWSGGLGGLGGLWLMRRRSWSLTLPARWPPQTCLPRALTSALVPHR
ncbi:MAG: hypothetical protein ACRDNF_01650 [Streptosporangiaceae bacterium]